MCACVRYNDAHNNIILSRQSRSTGLHDALATAPHLRSVRHRHHHHRLLLLLLHILLLLLLHILRRHLRPSPARRRRVCVYMRTTTTTRVRDLCVLACALQSSPPRAEIIKPMGQRRRRTRVTKRFRPPTFGAPLSKQRGRDRPGAAAMNSIGAEISSPPPPNPTTHTPDKDGSGVVIATARPGRKLLRQISCRIHEHSHGFDEFDRHHLEHKNKTRQSQIPRETIRIRPEYFENYTTSKYANNI